MEANYSDRLKNLRKTLGISQDALAEMINCGVASVRRWESGSTQPLPLYQEKIIQLENIDAVDVLKQKGAYLNETR